MPRWPFPFAQMVKTFGGVKQRLGIVTKKAKAAAPIRADPLANELIDMYGTCSLSAGQVGNIAAASAMSSSSSSHSGPPPVPAPPPAAPAVKRLAKAKAPKPPKGKASQGPQPSKNSSRTLMRALAHDTALPPPYMADVKVWDAHTDAPTTTPMAFIPIHEMLEVVVGQDGLEQWVSYEEQQQGFKARLHAWGSRVQLASATLASFLPIALWGDSAEFIHGDQLHLLLFTVMSGVCRRRFWICAFSKQQLCRCGCVGRCTYDSIWAVIAWMFRVLLSQRHPRKDHRGCSFPASSPRATTAGTPLGFGGACIAKCGDWAWFKGVLGMRGWRGEGAKNTCAGSAKPVSTTSTTAMISAGRQLGGALW